MELNFVLRSQILISEYTLEFRFKKEEGIGREQRIRKMVSRDQEEASITKFEFKQVATTGSDRFRGKHREWTNRISGNGPFFGR